MASASMISLSADLRAELDQLLAEVRHKAVMDTLETWSADPSKPQEGVCALERMARAGIQPQSFEWPDLGLGMSSQPLSGASGGQLSLHSMHTPQWTASRGVVLLDPAAPESHSTPWLAAAVPRTPGLGHTGPATADSPASAHFPSPVGARAFAAVPLPVCCGRDSAGSVTSQHRSASGRAPTMEHLSESEVRAPTPLGTVTPHAHSGFQTSAQFAVAERSEAADQEHLAEPREGAPRSAVLAALEGFDPERRAQLLKRLEGRRTGVEAR